MLEAGDAIRVAHPPGSANHDLSARLWFDEAGLGLLGGNSLSDLARHAEVPAEAVHVEVTVAGVAHDLAAVFYDQHDALSRREGRTLGDPQADLTRYRVHLVEERAAHQSSPCGAGRREREAGLGGDRPELGSTSITECEPEPILSSAS